MIAFATFFLGLVAGIHDVELIAGAEVAALELVLDGCTVATLSAPPWRTPVDLGAELEPHHLLAIARDERGGEVGRAEQWINVPRPLAQAEVVLDLDPAGQESRARLSWQSLAGPEPRSIVLLLDGAELAVEDPRSFPLPPYDPDQLHLLRAELEFEENLSAIAEATFGGFFADEVSTELTAVPLRVDGATPSLEALQNAVRSRGRAVRVIAVEDTPADIVVVRDLRSRRELNVLSADTRIPTSFGKQSRLRFVWTTPEVRRSGGGSYLLFPRTSDASVGGETFVRTLLRAGWPGGKPERQLLADAVAVAGLIASERNRPRAVVVLLGAPGSDGSQLDPKGVRHYLGTIGVPLFVWSMHASAWNEGGASGWGEVRDISTPVRLVRAIGEVREHLARQRVMWVHGIHLPQWIELEPTLPAVRILR